MDFEGGKIDLAEIGKDAHACLIDGGLEIYECYRTREEADARAAELDGSSVGAGAAAGFAGAPTALLGGQCVNWTFLYDKADGANAGGDRVQYRDVGFWQNLGGFANRTESILTGCSTSTWKNGTGQFNFSSFSYYPNVPYPNTYDLVRINPTP